VSKQYISPTVRERVAEHFKYRCAYCLTSQQVIGSLLEIDHIVPVARGGQSGEDNLALACPLCNGYKSDLVEAVDPQTNLRMRLFDPRRDLWLDHFAWSEDGTEIEALTAIGRATISALNMNHVDIVATRRLWVTVGWHPPQD